MLNHCVTVTLQLLLSNQGRFSDSLKEKNSVCSLRSKLLIAGGGHSLIHVSHKNIFNMLIMVFFLKVFFFIPFYCDAVGFVIRPANDLIQQQSPSPPHCSRATLFTHQLMACRSKVTDSHVSTVLFLSDLISWSFQ